MGNGLEAIHEELKRLKREGVDRVFVADATLASLKAAAIDPKTEPMPALLEPKPTIPPKSNPAGNIGKKAPAGVPEHYKPIPENPPEIRLPDASPEAQMDWLRERVLKCPVCNEHLNANGQVVFGIGSIKADIIFCGEAPGADEELAGEPFVGKAGQLLTKIISAMGLSREAVYITNILNWRPQHDKPYGNRPPTKEEMDYCLPYLRAQIEIIKPKAIVALGNTAVSGLLADGTHQTIGKIRGHWQEWEGIPLMATFHPSYLLRNDTLKTKRMVWEDLLKVMEKVGLPISEKQQKFFLPK